MTGLADVAFISFSLFLALYIRIGEEVQRWFVADSLLVAAIVVPSSVFIWGRLGLYRAVIRFLDVRALTTILWGSAASALILVLVSFVLRTGLPRSVPFIYFALVLICVAGSRLFARGLIQARHGGVRLPVAIYGAGSAGRQLCLALQNGYEYQPQFFVDDASELQGSSVLGVRVYAPEFLPELVKKYQIAKVLFAIPSVSPERKRVIFNTVQSLHIQMLTIPASAELIEGEYGAPELRTVSIEDLLGREEVKASSELLAKCLRNKVVVVTGAGGSIGSELCRQIVVQRPKQLILLEQSEYHLYSIQQELSDYSECLVPILGSVLDASLLENLFVRYQVNTLYHAAAYKHVPLVEHNIQAGVRNNVWGTYHLASLANKHGIDHFILISTDKAVRPTNVMGASKRLAELVVQAFAEQATDTVFSMVRFGNVLGSSGSVVPLFQSQIQAGGPVTVTHPEITRYFMTIPEAASLVIQAGAMAKGGDVFVLDMGQPVKIIDLAKKMIHLMGCEVSSEDTSVGGITIQYTGLRPGEKLYEELLIGGEVTGTEHPLIMRASEDFVTIEVMTALLDELHEALNSGDMESVRQLIINAPTAFSPSSAIMDWMHTYDAKMSEGLKLVANAGGKDSA